MKRESFTSSGNLATEVLVETPINRHLNASTLSLFRGSLRLCSARTFGDPRATWLVKNLQSPFPRYPGLLIGHFRLLGESWRFAPTVLQNFSATRRVWSARSFAFKLPSLEFIAVLGFQLDPFRRSLTAFATAPSRSFGKAALSRAIAQLALDFNG